MAIQKINISDFLTRRAEVPVFDVRSPGEYTHAHIPGALSLPLFTDEERKVVGTAYKQQSREVAVKVGLDYFGVKMRRMVEEVEELLKGRNDKRIIVHCWRGGMRSAGVAWLLDLYGFNVSTLVGGYKSYRKWVHRQFEQDHPIHIIGGYTGSGKTPVLNELAQKGHIVIDLEDLAKHKGSAFGAIAGVPQPKQEMFENLLAEELAQTKATTDNPIWMEDESQRIGNINIPPAFWKTMRNSPVYFLDIPFEERLKHIAAEYGQLDKEQLLGAVSRIQKRLGGLETKTTQQCLEDNDITGAFRILLKYYDKHYKKALEKRNNPDVEIGQIQSNEVNAELNTNILLRWKELSKSD